MKSTLIFIINLLICFNLKGQKSNQYEELDSIQLLKIDTFKAHQDKWLHVLIDRPYGYNGLRTESTIGIISKFQLGKNLYYSLAISKNLYSVDARGLWSNRNFSIGAEYNYEHQIIAPKVSFGESILFINYQLNALYYMTSKKNYPAFRPEIGFSLFRLQVSFGRNIFFEKMELDTINKWNISAYYYFPVLPRK